MSETERVGITPKSWMAQRHHGVLHLGKRWYVVSADIDAAGIARGVRLDGPYADHETAEAKVEIRGAGLAGGRLKRQAGRSLCDPANSFSGGPVQLVQYPRKGFDGDYVCGAPSGSRS